MTALLLSFLANPTVLAIIGGIVAALGWGWKQRRAGAASERAKVEKANAKARKTASEIDNDVAAMKPDDARAELKKWSKR